MTSDEIADLQARMLKIERLGYILTGLVMAHMGLSTAILAGV